MAALVVEEDVRLQDPQDRSLVDSSQEEGVVDAQPPLVDRVDRALVGGSAARRDDGDADPALVAARIGVVLGASIRWMWLIFSRNAASGPLGRGTSARALSFAWYASSVPSW